jgi:O-antigen/teichoic acid export membrane protein
MKQILSHIHEIRNSEFYRNIGHLFSGIFLARIIPALFALLIARVYAPENFGMYMLFLSISSLLSVFVNGGYEGALLISGNEARREAIFKFSLRINLTINSIVFIFILLTLFINPGDATHNLMQLLIPCYSFFFGATQMVRNRLISRKSFRRLATLEMVRALLTGILQSLCFIFPETGLFAGLVAAQIITFILFADISFPLTKGLFHRPDRLERALAGRYRRFPLFSLPAEFFNFLSQQLPVFLIKPFFGSSNLGLYSFSHRYLFIPVQMTGISIGSVYVEKAAALRTAPEELSGLTFSLYKKQIWLSLLPFTLIAFWGEPLFTFLFGPTWSYSGFLAQILSPWLFLVFISSPLSMIITVREKQKESMFFNILLLLIRALVLVAGGLWLKNLTYTIALFSGTGVLFFLFLGGWSLRLAGVNLSRSALFLLKALLICTLPLFLVWLWI